MMTRPTTLFAPAFALFVVTTPWPALAGKGAFLPTYHAAPCSGDDCRADDPKSGSSCQGFLCGFVSSKAMQPPVTAAQAAEMERARAAAEAQAAQAAPPVPAAPPGAPPAKKKRVAKVKVAPKPATAANASPTTAATATPAPPQAK